MDHNCYPNIGITFIGIGEQHVSVDDIEWFLRFDRQNLQMLSGKFSNINITNQQTLAKTKWTAPEIYEEMKNTRLAIQHNDISVIFIASRGGGEGQGQFVTDSMNNKLLLQSIEVWLHNNVDISPWAQRNIRIFIPICFSEYRPTNFNNQSTNNIQNQLVHEFRGSKTSKRHPNIVNINENNIDQLTAKASLFVMDVSGFGHSIHGCRYAGTPPVISFCDQCNVVGSTESGNTNTNAMTVGNVFHNVINTIYKIEKFTQQHSIEPSLCVHFPSKPILFKLKRANDCNQIIQKHKVLLHNINDVLRQSEEAHNKQENKYKFKFIQTANTPRDDKNRCSRYNRYEQRATCNDSEYRKKRRDRSGRSRSRSRERDRHRDRRDRRDSYLTSSVSSNNSGWSNNTFNLNIPMRATPSLNNMQNSCTHSISTHDKESKELIKKESNELIRKYFEFYEIKFDQVLKKNPKKLQEIYGVFMNGYGNVGECDRVSSLIEMKKQFEAKGGNWNTHYMLLGSLLYSKYIYVTHSNIPWRRHNPSKNRRYTYSKYHYIMTRMKSSQVYELQPDGDKTSSVKNPITWVNTLTPSTNVLLCPFCNKIESSFGYFRKKERKKYIKHVSNCFTKLV